MVEPALTDDKSRLYVVLDAGNHMKLLLAWRSRDYLTAVREEAKRYVAKGLGHLGHEIGNICASIQDALTNGKIEDAQTKITLLGGETSLFSTHERAKTPRSDVKRRIDPGYKQECATEQASKVWIGWDGFPCLVIPAIGTATDRTEALLFFTFQRPDDFDSHTIFPDQSQPNPADVYPHLYMHIKRCRWARPLGGTSRQRAGRVPSASSASEEEGERATHAGGCERFRTKALPSGIT